MTDESKLSVIVAESGLEQSKAQYLLEHFQGYFAKAAEWELKAKTIVVTSETQVDDMKIARIGRLALRDERLAVEKIRKELKEQSLREGKAIDGIANTLKAVIIPIEEYLEKQEKFIEIRQAEKEARILAEFRAKQEQERLAQEEADAKARAEEQMRIRKENERLQAEAAKREKEMAKMRAETEAAAKKAREEQNKLIVAQEKLAAENNAIKAELDRKILEAQIEKLQVPCGKEVCNVDLFGNEIKQKPIEVKALRANWLSNDGDDPIQANYFEVNFPGMEFCAVEIEFNANGVPFVMIEGTKYVFQLVPEV